MLGADAIARAMLCVASGDSDVVAAPNRSFVTCRGRNHGEAAILLEAADDDA